MINILIAIILYAAVFVSVEVFYRKLKMSFLFSRKVAHIAGSIVSCFLPYLMQNATAVCVGILFSVVILISKKKRIFKGIHDINGLSIGEVVFPLGIALSALIVWPISVIAYQGSCLVLGFSDGLAGYIGATCGKKRYVVPKGEKTIEGSLVFMLFTLVIFYLYVILFVGNITFFENILLIIYTIMITFIEAILSRGWDNLLIPITAGLALVLIIS